MKTLEQLGLYMPANVPAEFLKDDRNLREIEKAGSESVPSWVTAALPERWTAAVYVTTRICNGGTYFEVERGQVVLQGPGLPPMRVHRDWKTRRASLTAIEIVNIPYGTRLELPKEPNMFTPEKATAKALKAWGEYCAQDLSVRLKAANEIADGKKSAQSEIDEIIGKMRAKGAEITTRQEITTAYLNGIKFEFRVTQSGSMTYTADIWNTGKLLESAIK